MPNLFKHNATGTESDSLFKGDWAINLKEHGGGPTGTTGFYNGVDIPTGGYAVYGPGNHVRIAADEAELLFLVGKLGGDNSSISAALTWAVNTADVVIVDRLYESIVTNGLVLNLDAGFIPSYPISGTSLYDLSGAENHAILVNGPTYTSENGGVLSFDGSNDRVELSNTPYWKDNVFGNATNFTIMCWTKCNSFYNWSSMIHKDNGGYYSESEGASLWINASGFQAVFGNGIPGNSGDWGNIISYSTNDTSNWYHLAFTGNGSTLRFYVNGNLHASQGQSQRTAGKDITDTPVRFGVRANSAHYNGKISGSLLYDRELSSTEVLQNFNAQKTRFGL
jgi:hypothetical protein